MASKTKYDRQVEKMIAQAERMQDVQAAKAIRQLAAARKKIEATVATTEWELYSLPSMKKAVDGAMLEFSAHVGVDISEAGEKFWDYGTKMVDLPISAAGVAAVIPAIDTAVLVAMQSYSSALIESLGRDAAGKIYNEIAMGLMGQKSPYDVMQSVGKNLKDPGIFKSIAARAETITRQESARILEAASQARMMEAAKAVPGLKKQWKHGTSRVPRLSHLAAEGQIRDVDKPFDVGGEKLMYPRDPAGTPGNTINCSCYTVPYMDAWTGQDRAAA